MSDELFIINMKVGGALRDESIEFLYGNLELRQKIFGYLKRLGSKEEDIKDIYHDAFVVLDKNIRNEKFRGESSIEGYFFAICKFLCLNLLRKNKRLSFESDVELTAQLENDPTFLISEDNLITEEHKQVIELALSMIGEMCKNVLSLWKLSYSMIEIAEKLGLSSSEMAKKKRYQCHKKLVELINNNPDLKKALLNT